MPRSATAAAAVKERPLPLRRPAFGGGGPPGGGRQKRLISNGRLGILMLLATETTLFAGLLVSLMVYRFGAAVWPPQGLPRLPIGVTLVNTAILLSSARTMNLSVRAVRANRLRRLNRLLNVTAFLGTIFLVVQGSEWVRLIAHGLYISSGTYGATFYTLIGCHGIHVMGALVWLLCVVWLASRGRYNAFNYTGIDVCAIYWYFVCSVWPILFVLVYL